jgi:hypothetical protein
MLKHACFLGLAALIGLAASTPAQAFCGFYVAKADAKLFNKASKVVIAHQALGPTEHEIAITMASDYEGDPKEFAVVTPVPTFIARKQIGIVEMPSIEHLDAFTAPRLVEYRDENPCADGRVMRTTYGDAAMAVPGAKMEMNQRYKGVTVEATYDVGEYDVSILSAKESDGLVNWLTDNGYKLPDGAEQVLGSYIKQKMRFFIAKVNLDRMALLGQGFLRPLQVRYKSEKFMIPIRLGTLNASGPQDLIAYVLSPKGRVEVTNYRTVALPTGMDLPLYVKKDFGTFYKALFEREVQKHDMRAVFLEYAWDMGWCDPCAADPMKKKELVELGARWIDGDEDVPFMGGGGRGRIMGGGETVYVTRLHVRYDAQRFPEDLMLQATPNRQNFQGRYVLRHPWRGEANCKAGDAYFDGLPNRYWKEAETLANLTGWNEEEIRAKMEENGQPFASQRAGGIGPFFRRLFGGD